MNKPVLASSKAITIFLVFALGYFISTLLRAITATISPELVSEFNLSSGELGLLGGGYFLGFASVQIPLGYLLDSKGPRKIVSYFLSLSIVGLILFATAQNLTIQPMNCTQAYIHVYRITDRQLQLVHKVNSFRGMGVTVNYVL